MTGTMDDKQRKKEQKLAEARLGAQWMASLLFFPPRVLRWRFAFVIIIIIFFTFIFFFRR